MAVGFLLLGNKSLHPLNEEGDSFVAVEEAAAAEGWVSSSGCLLSISLVPGPRARTLVLRSDYV